MANLWRKIALTGVTATVAIAFNIIGAKPASAQTSVRCESIDYEYNECPLDTRGGVTLEVDVHSREYCRLNRNWGTGRGFVWVDNGCRATFRSVRRWEYDNDDDYYRDRDRRNYRRYRRHPQPRRYRRRSPVRCY
ncbi:DUF3011 domain-containing protein [Microseira wollei]|uniref:DUF3011 domain-containing protein n=1 Tax=Microseira wollei NIES-4236 TaxID=2530354 RepID=A0AAV3X552_9CYAN|nr:DUF3011 domain-containing protein [Microseira wollei]GET36448.1 hypothetical protein MiSe_11990 [Microseira wollei NIES-4236]